MLITSITVSIPRNVFDQMGGFPVGIKHGEDFLLWSKIALQYKVAYCNTPLSYYNNDVPPSMRATRNLYPPEYHFVFHFSMLENEIFQLKDDALKEDWKRLLGKIRLNQLFKYWINNQYHELAVAELSKVNMEYQPKSLCRKYNMPIWMLHIWLFIMKIGSFCKQKIIYCIYK